MFRAALIDLDGFLINSEELYLEANKLYFQKHHNFTFTKEHHRQGTGQKFDKWIKTIIASEKSGADILTERNVFFFNLVKKKLILFDGAKELLTVLHKHFKTALVTSSTKDYVNLIFSKIKIASYFDLLVTGDMVTHGKPDPECYLKAAQKLGFNPSECLVFEDAPSGVLAGEKAGMRVVAVPSPYVKGDTSFKKADFVFDTLGEISLTKIIG